MDRSAILATQGFLVVAHDTMLVHQGAEFTAVFRPEIDLAWNIYLQELVAAGVPQHTHHGVIDFDKPSLRTGEVQPFLDVVEQLAIAAFRLAAIGNVLKHVDGLQTLAVGAVNTRSRNQVGAVQHRMDVLVAGIRIHTTEGA